MVLLLFIYAFTQLPWWLNLRTYLQERQEASVWSLSQENPLKKEMATCSSILTPLEAQLVKNPPAMWETWVWSLGWEDPLKKEMATDSSILAWRIPWTAQSMGSQRVGHDWVTFTFLYLAWKIPWTEEAGRL